MLFIIGFFSFHAVFDVHHKSPLHWAAEMDHPNFLEFLLKHGGYGLINTTDLYDQTPLHYAAESGNVDVSPKAIAFIVC